MLPFGSMIFAKMMKSESKSDHTSHRNVPCDILLIGGTCVANESILTGEAIPQVKEAVSGAELPEMFSEGKFKQNILFCGT